MAELVLTDVNDAILQRLRERATTRRRTPQEEAKAILAEVLQGQSPDAWAQVDAIYRRLAASGRTFGDSTELLREDRDR